MEHHKKRTKVTMLISGSTFKTVNNDKQFFTILQWMQIKEKSK